MSVSVLHNIWIAYRKAINPISLNEGRIQIKKRELANKKQQIHEKMCWQSMCYATQSTKCQQSTHTQVRVCAREREERKKTLNARHGVRK